MARQAIIIGVDGTQPGDIVKTKFPLPARAENPPSDRQATFTSGSR
jgi:hypothetical protein